MLKVTDLTRGSCFDNCLPLQSLTGCAAITSLSNREGEVHIDLTRRTDLPQVKLETVLNTLELFFGSCREECKQNDVIGQLHATIHCA